MSVTNTIPVIEMITNETLEILENNLVLSKYVNRNYDKEFGRKGAKIGTTLQIRKPARPIAAQGPALNLQNFVETEVPVTLSYNPNVGLSFSNVELELEIDLFSDRVLAPSISAIANQVDANGLALYSSVYNMVGTPGTVPNSSATYLAARQRLAEEAVPDAGQRSVILSPGMEGAAIQIYQGFLNPTEDISQQYKTGKLGKVYNMKFSCDQNVVAQSFGALGGSPIVDGASQTGSNLATSGWTDSTLVLNAGDVITLPGVYAVNPQSYQSTGALRNFVVTAAVTSNSSGDATIPIYPAITPTSGTPNTVSGATVTASPANSAVVTPLFSSGVYSMQGLAFHRDAFCLVSADLDIPGGVDKAFRAHDDQVGLSVLVVRQYDINYGNFPTRVELLYGWAAMRPEFAVRIAS